MYKTKAFLCLLMIFLLPACGGGSSSSGADIEPTVAGQNIPANFIGVYTGTLNVRIEASGLSESDSFPITVTVTSDGMVRFDGDDPDETFTVGLTNQGEFAGNLPVMESDCTGQVAVQGRVDGTTASGTVIGSGDCEVSGLRLDVDLSGDFNATKT